MAVTITVAELAAALRLGDSAEETAEATRLRNYAIAAVSRHLGDAYEDTDAAVVNESAIRLSGYLFDQPTASRGMMYADALRNSGAAAILLPYRVHRAGSTAETSSDDPLPPIGGLVLHQSGSQTFEVATANEWVATTLPAPQTDIAGISVIGPDGTETGIQLFRIAVLTGAGVAGGDATAALDRMFAFETAADGTVLFASKVAGTHTAYLYELRT